MIVLHWPHSAQEHQNLAIVCQDCIFFGINIHLFLLKFDIFTKILFYYFSLCLVLTMIYVLGNHKKVLLLTKHQKPTL